MKNDILYMQAKGFTLLEGVIVLIILIVLSSITIPFFKKNSTHDLHQATKKLKEHLELAKSVAANQQVMVAVCGSSDAKTCDQQWNKGYIVFIDKQAKGIKEEGASLIALQRYEEQVFNINWNGFLSGGFIQFSPGFMQGQNGTLTLSDQDGNNQRIILNSAGRIRVQGD